MTFSYVQHELHRPRSPAQQLNLRQLLDVLRSSCLMLNSAAVSFWQVFSLVLSYLNSQSSFQWLGDVI